MLDQREIRIMGTKVKAYLESFASALELVPLSIGWTLDPISGDPRIVYSDRNLIKVEGNGEFTLTVLVIFHCLFTGGPVSCIKQFTSNELFRI
ncbi:hypothetical protein NDK43_06980 [Neobacillus pocheonensis]|uniref:Uncharacterized protein n=1 Tax=Neobacillus pocheonensis TaxID=363869 RepID=A0ABT0W7Z2_9BACI|nr:hypothetical protein [Neobacillus pocheonensis]